MPLVLPCPSCKLGIPQLVVEVILELYIVLISTGYVDEFVIKNAKGEIIATVKPDDPSQPNNQKIQINTDDLVRHVSD